MRIFNCGVPDDERVIYTIILVNARHLWGEPERECVFRLLDVIIRHYSVGMSTQNHSVCSTGYVSLCVCVCVCVYVYCVCGCVHMCVLCVYVYVYFAWPVSY